MRATARLLLMLCILIPMMCVIFPFWALGMEPQRKRFSHLTSRMLCHAIGLRVRCVGAPDTHRPLLAISNHCSYADIFVLGAAIPISFTPKSDIRLWPLVGWCCALSGCVFIERKAGKLPQAQKQIEQGLKMGRTVCLFAEGTTNDGTHLQHFKSGFFSLAEAIPELHLQPIALRYTHRNGQPLDAAGRRQIAWHDKDATLLPHLMRFLSWRSVDVEVVFLPVVTPAQGATRKSLAAQCEQLIGEALAYPDAAPAPHPSPTGVSSHAH